MLRKFALRAKGEEYAFEQYKNDCQEDLPDNELFPRIATLIEKDFNRVWYRAPEFKEHRGRFRAYIDKGVSPFKIELANHTLKAKVQSSKKELQDELSLLKQLGRKSVAGVITTNYDTLMEKIFDFTTFIGQEELLFNPSQAVAEIYKIHGCCQKPESIVITTKDYDHFNERNAYLSAKLLTIFLEHPIIFIGYSISDSNIQAILKSIVGCLSQEKLEQLRNRLFFVEWSSDEENYKISSHTIQFGVDKSLEMTRVSVKTFGKLYYTLLQNKGKYNVKLLRQLKQDVYELILREEPKGCIHVANIDDDTQLEQVEVVIGVGINKEIAELGISAPEAEDLYRDIIYDDGAFNSNIVAFVDRRLPQLMARNSNSLPLWKYVSAYQPKEIPLEIGEHLKYCERDFMYAQALTKRRDNPIEERSIQELEKKYSPEECLTQILYLQQEQIDRRQLYAFLKKFLDNNPNYLNPTNKNGRKTNLKRLVKVYDWMTYGEKKGGA